MQQTKLWSSSPKSRRPKSWDLYRMVDGMAVVHCRTLAGARAPAGRRACGAGEGALVSSRPVHRSAVRLRSVARRPVPRAALRAVLLDPFDAPGRDVAGRVLVRVAVPSAAGAVKERAAAALRVSMSTPRAGGRGPSRVHLDAPGAVAHAAPLDALVELGEPRFRQRVVQGPCVREERSTDIRRCKSPIRNWGRAEVGVLRGDDTRAVQAFMEERT